MKTILLDAGHGGNDPGCVFGDKVEKTIALDFCLTLKFLLIEEGYNVKLTRRLDSENPSFQSRLSGKGDLLISLHCNSAGTYPLIYYSDGNPESYRLAATLDKHFRSGRLWKSSQSNHGGLWIDRAKYPAVIVELDAIDRIVNMRDERIVVAQELIEGIKEYLGD